MTRTLILALVMAFASSAAHASTADILTDCSTRSIEDAGIKHVSNGEAAVICETVRARLHFDLTESDLQHLVDVSAVAQLTAMKGGFDLPAVTAELLPIVGSASWTASSVSQSGWAMCP